MNELSNLPNILTDMARDVASKGNSQRAAGAFKAYKQCLEPLVEPYVGNGYLGDDKTLARFFSETATLHLAVSLISHWATRHKNDMASTEDVWEIHQEFCFFSWYKIPQPLSDQIRDWVALHADSDDILQAFALAADNSLAGLRRHSLGEFSTPMSIAEHLVELIQHDPTTMIEKKVVDPACGRGNLLTALVRRTAQAVRSGSLAPLQALAALNSNIFGFDVQPFAVLMTRLQLVMASLSIWKLCETSGTSVYEILSFPGIQLRDPLSEPNDLWDLAPFDVVVSNPPFLKVKKSSLPFVEQYQKVLYGHVNVYQLFLWWAMRATQPSGRLVFLVPQSVRSGQYSSRLRSEITESCDMLAITSFMDRTGVFNCVRQPVMAIALNKPASESQERPVKVRMSANGQTLGQIPALTIDQRQVILTQDGVSTWCVSSERNDYGILAKAFEEDAALGTMSGFSIVNGGFVWNQHTDRLKPTENDYTLPLISAASLGVHRFVFPPSDKRVSGRLFADASPPVPGPVYEETCILLKRTTPKIMGGRRIVATMLQSDFLEKYGGCFAENHVNVILSPQGAASTQQLLGLCAWLNSRLANFIFGMLNVSSHLSKFDLSLIPVPTSLLRELISLAECLADDPTEKDRRRTLERIDQKTFKFFGLSSEESQRVRQVVPSAS